MRYIPIGFLLLFLIIYPIAAIATTSIPVAPINAKVLGANEGGFVVVESVTSFRNVFSKSVKVPVVTTYV